MPVRGKGKSPTRAGTTLRAKEVYSERILNKFDESQKHVNDDLGAFRGYLQSQLPVVSDIVQNRAVLESRAEDLANYAEGLAQENARLRKELDAAQGKYRSERHENSRIRKGSQGSEVQVKELESENDRLRSIIAQLKSQNNADVDLRRRELREKIIALEKELTEGLEEVSKMKAENSVLSVENRELRDRINRPRVSTAVGTDGTSQRDLSELEDANHDISVVTRNLNDIYATSSDAVDSAKRNIETCLRRIEENLEKVDQARRVLDDRGKKLDTSLRDHTRSSV